MRPRSRPLLRHDRKVAPDRSEHLGDYGLSITLALLFFGAWALQTWTGWVEFVA